MICQLSLQINRLQIERNLVSGLLCYKRHICSYIQETALHEFAFWKKLVIECLATSIVEPLKSHGKRVRGSQNFFHSTK